LTRIFWPVVNGLANREITPKYGKKEGKRSLKASQRMDPKRSKQETKKKEKKEGEREIDVQDSSKNPGMKAVKSAGVILFKKDNTLKGKSFLLMKPLE